MLVELSARDVKTCVASILAIVAADEPGPERDLVEAARLLDLAQRLLDRYKRHEREEQARAALDGEPAKEQP